MFAEVQYSAFFQKRLQGSILNKYVCLCFWYYMYSWMKESLVRHLQEGNLS